MKLTPIDALKETHVAPAQQVPATPSGVLTPQQQLAVVARKQRILTEQARQLAAISDGFAERLNPLA